MKKIFIVVALISLTACSTIQSVKEWIPSFWDDNQSKVITDLQINIRRLDCSQPLSTQLDSIEFPLIWLNIYSETKGTKDVLKLTATLDETFKEFKDRVQAGPISPIYCDLKKKIFIDQSNIIAKAIQGRF
jgi:hypothetical protein